MYAEKTQTCTPRKSRTVPRRSDDMAFLSYASVRPRTRYVFPTLDAASFTETGVTIQSPTLTSFGDNPVWSFPILVGDRCSNNIVQSGLESVHEHQTKSLPHRACVDASFVMEYNTANPWIINPLLDELAALSRAQLSRRSAEILLWTRFPESKCATMNSTESKAVFK